MITSVRSSTHLAQCCLRFSASRIRKRWILVASTLVCLLSPIAIALSWYPPYPQLPPNGPPTAVKYILPAETIVVERVGGPLMRATRFWRSEPGEKDPQPIPPQFAARVAAKSGATVRSLHETYHVATVQSSLNAARSPAPSYLKLSQSAPFGLVAEYGWPFTSVRCFATGSLEDCALQSASLHSAIVLSTERHYITTYYGWWPFRVQAGLYSPDVPFGNIPTGVAIGGLFGNIAFVASVIYSIILACLWTRTFRRGLRHQCLACGYEIDPLAAGPCPECGLQESGHGRASSRMSNPPELAPTTT